MYLLDTNVPSELARERADSRVADFLLTVDRQNVFLSVMTLGEIMKGISALPASRRREHLELWFESDVRSRFANRILPITQEIAERWGSLSAMAKQRGMALSVVDGLIAATALEHGLTLATRNTKDFVGLGVKILNPWDQ